MEEKAPAKRPSSKMFVRVSKFKHLKGDVMLKGKFENLKNLSKSVPAESNLIEGKNPLFKNTNKVCHEKIGLEL